MKKKKKRIPAKISEKFIEKIKTEEPGKRRLNPEDPYEESRPPIKGMPTTRHPHQEEILD